jgi:superfamily I DNA and/or RNA helicase
MWDKQERKMKSLPTGERKWPSAPHISGAIKPWCFNPARADYFETLWKSLIMVSDLEYNSGFELFEGWLSNNKRNDRIVSLNVQHRMHPKIAEFNSQVVYGNEYHSSSKMVDRGFPTRILGTPLKKDDSLILLDTSLFGKEAMEQLDEGKLGRYVNVAEAKVIVEAIDDIAKDLASIPHPDDRYWEIAVISFYKAQAAAIQKALRVSDVVESKGRRFVDKKTKSVRIEVNVVDRFQGREADVVLLPMTRANKRGSLGFMTVLNRINVATSRARHRLLLVGNARQLEEMGVKYDARNADEDLETSMTENTAPKNFVSQLINHVQKNGRSLQISPKDLRNDWKGIDLVRKPRNGRKRGVRK